MFEKKELEIKNGFFYSCLSDKAEALIVELVHNNELNGEREGVFESGFFKVALQRAFRAGEPFVLNISNIQTKEERQFVLSIPEDVSREDILNYACWILQEKIFDAGLFEYAIECGLFKQEANGYSRDDFSMRMEETQ